MVDAVLIENIVDEVIGNKGNITHGESCPLDCDYCGHCAEKNLDLVKKILGDGADRIDSSLHTAVFDKEIAHQIDHTLLKPDATEEDIVALCKEAKLYEFASVCVNPYWVKTCKPILEDTNVKVCTVIGFPLGATAKEVKAIEAAKAVADGAQEVDMVINIGALKSKQYDVVKEDIRYVVNAVPDDVIVKVIIETALLTKDEKIKACEFSKESGADFVKTSTGFSKGGATIEDVRLMREVVGSALGVKASGGIHSHEEAEAMIKAGASRIGASASIKIVGGDNDIDATSGY